nr:hypothetical protein 8 [Micrococcaceae bacterium]
MTITLLAACDLNMAIGYKNELLVKLPNDMKHFRQLTENNFVVFGRKTLESIGKPLSNRINLILTKNKKYDAPVGCYVYNSIEDLLNEYYNYADEPFQYLSHLLY